uniref:Uncharacterized protein n=1 Tax=Lactuca sativa TaxID=4236 RepID=A0A9R1V3Q5_LACSA|nr:hypothetical protein LSAT_V11C700370440 [Lactuca sativa]
MRLIKEHDWNNTTTIGTFGPSTSNRKQVRSKIVDAKTMFVPKSNIMTSETLAKPNHRSGPNSSALPQGESPFFRSKSYQPNSSSFQMITLIPIAGSLDESEHRFDACRGQQTFAG